MLRWIGFGVLGLLALALVAIGAAYLLIGRYDLASFAAGRASAALGRPVAVGGLHVTPGRWVMVDLDRVRLDNIDGGSRPAMLELAHLTAEVDALSLLHGPAVLRRLAVDGLSVLLERTAGGTANWKFGPPKPKPDGPADRSWFPTLLDARMRGSELTFRTTGGTALRTRVDELAIQTAAADQPVRLTLGGAYNDTPVRLDGDLQPIAALRDAAVPYGTRLHVASGATALEFDGTMTEPLGLDGAEGRLTLDAPTPGPLLAIAGAPGSADLALRLAGKLERRGDLWRLTEAAGTLNDSKIGAASLRLQEGTRGKPDDVAADIAFDRLDLNQLMGAGGRGSRPDADIPLGIDRAPDTLIEARITTRELVYAGVRAEDATFAAALTPGRVAVKELALTYSGARAKASGQVEAADKGGKVTADLAVSGAEVQQLRRLLEFGPVPLQGRLTAQVAVSASGATLNAAARTANVAAVVSMTGGAIAREVVEMASTDVRLLFRKAKGMSAVSCLLAALDMRGGVGTVSPLRVRAADGTIAGMARFDLNRRWFDLTIGSEAKTTGFFALDIPVRVSGSFASPSVAPARWSDGGRALLAATDTVGHLPPGMRDLARRNPCSSAR